ncbi:MAG TPA: lysophospholipid acyltransferase family protein [Candidatus Eisenbacteria bacterium]
MAHSPLRPLRQKIEVAALHAIGFLARLLPFSWTSALGAGVGLVAFQVMGRRRRIAIDNITRALGPEVQGMSARELARRTFAQIGRSFMEFLALPRLGPKGILDRVEMIGYEPAFEWARRGEGAVMLTAHYGNWELLGAAVRASGGPVRYLLPPQSNEGSDAYFDRIRERLGIEAVKIGYGMRGALKALRQGAFLGMLPDQDARRVGIHVPFFGRPASTHTGPARLAYRARCPILIALVEREPGAHFRSRVVAILKPDPGAEESREVERLTRAINETIEAGVRRRPDHWYWLHRRWKTPPPA